MVEDEDCWSRPEAALLDPASVYPRAGRMQIAVIDGVFSVAGRTLLRSDGAGNNPTWPVRPARHQTPRAADCQRGCQTSRRLGSRWDF